MEKNIFKSYLEELNIELTDEKYEKLSTYYTLLKEWNEKINLTSIIEEESVYIKHFYDSLTINKIIDLSTVKTLCDVGTGAGFPGIVIKIMFPNIKVTLVDSLTKRINFLNLVKEKLNLEDLEIVNSRAEDYSRKKRECFDIVTSRAVAKLNILLEISFPLVKEKGYFIALKSKTAKEEIEQSKNELKILDAQIEDIMELKLPKINDERTLIKIKKLSTTKKKYPREFKQISTKPL